jgi:hypothetical protein
MIKLRCNIECFPTQNAKIMNDGTLGYTFSTFDAYKSSICVHKKQMRKYVVGTPTLSDQDRKETK